MNLSTLRKLKKGDKIVFKGWPWKLTDGKEYEIFADDFGHWIIDDNGMGRRVGDTMETELLFNPL
ncbi:MAG TPA: hypothetical protein ACFYEK_18070 [Candidatus Wunengus sp. YC60]|uniref:hypothetical protein n=1 Tax=Candidatus Wunengus sp. YC60 TaxID=3367697 RepID=UPI004026D718